MTEFVVLVNEKNKPLGLMPKSKVHTLNTPLHRGFSVFLFNLKGYLLIQQRSGKKKTWPYVWSNSCCGHPYLKESNIKAAQRRLKFELGITKAEIYEVISDYRYKAEKNGIVENEICPILVAFSSQKPKINKDEVEAIKWILWPEFIKEISKYPDKYSPWCQEEVLLLKENEKFNLLYAKYIQNAKIKKE